MTHNGFINYLARFTDDSTCLFGGGKGLWYICSGGPGEKIDATCFFCRRCKTHGVPGGHVLKIPRISPKAVILCSAHCFLDAKKLIRLYEDNDNEVPISGPDEDKINNSSDNTVCSKESEDEKPQKKHKRTTKKVKLEKE